MKTTLEPQQVTAALIKITSHWATQPLADSVRDTWRRKLETLAQGEFTPAFDAWLDSPRSRFRPDVGEFMEIIAKHRGSTTHQEQFDRTQRFLADQRAVTPARQEHVADVLAKARATLGEAEKRQLDRPEVKARTLDEAKLAFRRYVEVATEGDEESQAAIDAWRALTAILAPEAA